MQDSGPRKVSRRKLLGGAAGAVAAVPLVHELVPHQGVHDQFASAQDHAGHGGDNGSSEHAKGSAHRGTVGRVDPAVNGFDPASMVRDFDAGTVTREGGRTVRDVRARGRGQGDRGRARRQVRRVDLQRPRARADAARDRGRPRAGEVRQRLRPPAHDPLPRHPHGAARRRARSGRGEHRSGQVVHLRVRGRRPSACTSTTATPRRWPTTSPRASTAPSSSIRRSRARRPTSC